MALIKSISGIRGTIGGRAGDNLTPQDIVASAAAFGFWLIERKNTRKIVIGRDARISGEIVSGLVAYTLRALGIDVVDVGLSTTPTVEMAVVAEAAGGGIILTASHNPKQWNALKLLNERGEFISASDGAEVLRLIEENAVVYAEIDKLGSYTAKEGYIQYHIDRIFELPLVNVEAVRTAAFKVVLDSVNSTGSISMTPLLEQLGCEVVQINGDPTGKFAHNPEPLPENLSDLAQAVTYHKAALGIAVDPDVDRLVLVCEDGSMFGEEYTLVAVADYVLKHTPSAVVSNLSSTRALADVAAKYGQKRFVSAVGEVNVVTMMREENAIIGGEGNGGIIYPALHAGRDAMLGIALFLSHLAALGKPASFVRGSYPNYTMSKNKITLTPEIDLEKIFAGIEARYKSRPINKVDGLFIEFDGGDWVHLRKSNTEPIIRIYSESSAEVTANNLVSKLQKDISEIVRGVE